MTTVSPDVDPLIADANQVTLEDGLVVNIERLKTRQLLKLLKIVTNGAGPMLGEMEMPDADDEEGTFAKQLLAIVVMAIPNAEEETIEFVRSIVTPGDFIRKPRSAGDRKMNDELFEKLFDATHNPEILDLVKILRKMVEIEAKEIQRLGKELVAIFQVVRPGAAKSASKKTSGTSTQTGS